MSSHARPSRHAHGKWEGAEALQTALQGLASAKGTSQKRISAVAKLALQHAKLYKHVVHDVEVFLWKAEPEHRLAGLYAIDAIIRQGGTRNEAKEQYAKRFAIRLSDTLKSVKAAPADAQIKVRQVVEEWQRRGIYTTSAIKAAGGDEFALRDDSPTKQERERYSPTHSITTPTASSGQLASLLSIIKKKKEQEHDHPSSGSSDQHYHRDEPQPEYYAYDNRQRDVSPYRQQDRHGDVPPYRQQDRPQDMSPYHQQDRQRDLSPYRQQARQQDASPYHQQDRQRDLSPYQQQDRHRDVSPYHQQDRQRDVSPYGQQGRQRDVSPYGQRDLHQSSGDLRSQRISQGIMGDAPPSLLGARPPRTARSDDRAPEWNDESTRSVKKQRSSRWGPPKPAGEVSMESRPPSIITSAPMGSTDDIHSRTPGDVGIRHDSRVSSSFHNAQDAFHPPSSGGRGPDSFGRYDGPFEQPPRHNGPGALVNHGFSSRPEDAGDRIKPGNSPGSDGPSARYADRSSPHHQQQQMQISGNQQPGGSGEICRKFLAGRCTFGDRCWHVHDPQSVRPPPQPQVATEAKRKTVLCNNFPIGRCRYGDKCSFAHGAEDLGSARPNLPPAAGRSGFNESPRGRWDSASGQPPVTAGNTAPGSQPVHPSSSAPPPVSFPPQHFARQIGAGVPPPAVLNEPQDGRGAAGTTRMSNGGIIGSGAPPPAPPHPMRLQGPAAPYGAGPPPRGPPGPQSSVLLQAPRAGNYTGPPPPPVRMDAGRMGMPPHAYMAAEKSAAVLPPKPRQASRLDEDDEPEEPVEEFMLQYDDED